MSPQQQQPQIGGRQFVPMALGGSFLAGDASAIPEESSRLVRNMLHRPGNRMDARPPFVYDSLMSVNGLAVWEDLTNQQTRFVALDTLNAMQLKSTSGEAWGAVIGGGAGFGSRLTSYANYRGNLYLMLDDGAGNPTAAWVYDGSTIVAASITDNPYSSAPRPFNSFIAARCVATFIDRLFFAYPRIEVAPYNGGGLLSPTVTAYDWTDNVTWAKTNVGAYMTTLASGVQVCRLYPQSLAANACRIDGPIGLLVFGATTADTLFTWRAELRGVDPNYDVPVTLELIIVTPIQLSANYGVGDLVSNGSFRYRCIVAGVSAAAPPIYTTTPGQTTVDGTVTWLCEGPNVLASSESASVAFTSVPSISANQSYSQVYLPCILPAHTNTVTISGRLKFYNTVNTALTQLSPIDISLKDGRLDTDPSKNNHGHQWTSGDFFYPFFNNETALTRIVNLESIMWSEQGEPRQIRATNTYQPKEAAGLPTALVVSAGRLVMMKRRAIWTFNGTDDPDNPILPEGPAQIGFGTVGPLAIDQLDDEMFFVGEAECYRMRIGSLPLPICGDAMREEIMDRSAGRWVEDQPTWNNALLAVDPINREVWVYTQRGKLYCYHDMLNRLPFFTATSLPTEKQGMWSVHDIGEDDTIEVAALRFNPVTRKMEIAIGDYGLTRLDPSAYGVTDTVSATSSRASSAQIIFRPLESFAPRYDAIVEEIAPYQSIMRLPDQSYVPQQGVLTAGISTDRGITFPRYDSVTIDPSVPRLPIPIWQMQPSITLSLRYDGPLSAFDFSLSKCEAIVQPLTDEQPQVLPTQVGSSL